MTVTHKNLEVNFKQWQQAVVLKSDTTDCQKLFGLVFVCKIYGITFSILRPLWDKFAFVIVTAKDVTRWKVFGNIFKMLLTT